VGKGKDSKRISVKMKVKLDPHDLEVENGFHLAWKGCSYGEKISENAENQTSCSNREHRRGKGREKKERES
jgi:hypothetical protein